METIVNFLRLTAEEREAFQAAAPGQEQLFRPVDTQNKSAETASPQELERATVIIGCVSPKALAGCPRLKWLQTWSAGVDPYLAPGVLPQGCMLTSAVGGYGPAVSEHMLATALAVMKGLPILRDNQRAHRREKIGQVKSFLGATVLLLGVGDIGSHFAQKAKALGAYTIGLSRRPERIIPGVDELHPFDQLDQWLPQADLVAMSLPETPETVGLMDRRRLGLMGEGAILINAGRGSAVDGLALAEALRAGRLWGAALDVTKPEPLPEEHPLWDCPNLLLTPHTAGGDRMEVTRRRIAAIALENLGRYLAGEELRNRMR
ncbi:MAG: D-2-hydroxyacid dehydrogenase [Oscillospiraceae bacterium]|nr:D-2-hydroxyacid dehydrogenase [Oscillospiraceae bacterium]